MGAEREIALNELSGLCESSSFPTLEPEELGAIIDSSIRAKHWAPDTFFAIGTVVYPLTRNGRRYKVIVSGITEATEPSSWATSTEGHTSSGGVTFEEEGIEFPNVYDMDAATKKAWLKKAAKASRLMATGGMNMSKVFDNCLKMAEQYDLPLVG